MALTQKEVETFLSNLTNYTGEREAGQMFSKALQNEHRTLQSAFWRIMRDAVIPDYTKVGSDPRNEHAVAYAKLLNESKNSYLPLI